MHALTIRRCVRPTLALILAAILCGLTTHATASQMGEPLKAGSKAQSGEAKAAAAEFAIWEAKWRELQGANDKVDWIDHFRVCAIKFRDRKSVV